MAVIHIFNPETDYSLASFSPYYTPPASVIALRRDRAFLPATYALEGDYILTLDTLPTPSDFPSGLNHIQLSDLQSLFDNENNADSNSSLKIQPWGWNPALKHTLLQSGVPESFLPSDSFLANLRKISHRATTIPFVKEFISTLRSNGNYTVLTNDNTTSQYLPPLSKIAEILPVIFTKADEALQWLRSVQAVGKEAFFKAPWSSSGRGILFTDELDADRHISPWLSGIIRRQGCVIGEEAASKLIDFATEWHIVESDKGPDAQFVGLSLFEASRRGKYHANYDGDQSQIKAILKEKGVELTPGLLNAQKYALEKLCRSYRGYCGIDMLADTNGVIYPCIEINWRMTMGIIPLIKSANHQAIMRN